MSDQQSLNRAAINKENAAKSTGPKTEAGKQKSSLNALRHGLTGQIVVMPGEDLAAYQSFTQSFHDDLQPAGAVETQLVQSLADDAWRLNRAKALENNLLSLGLYEKAASILTEREEVRDALAMAEALREQTKALSTLSTHQNRLARTFERSLTLLRQIQAERREQERIEMMHAGRIYRLHARQNKLEGKSEPYNPSRRWLRFDNSPNRGISAPRRSPPSRLRSRQSVQLSRLR